MDRTDVINVERIEKVAREAMDAAFAPILDVLGAIQSWDLRQSCANEPHCTDEEETLAHDEWCDACLLAERVDDAITNTAKMLTKG